MFFIWWEFLNLEKQATYWNSHYSLIWEPETTLIRNVHLTSILRAIGFKLYETPDVMKWQGVRRARPIRARAIPQWIEIPSLKSIQSSVCAEIYRNTNEKWDKRARQFLLSQHHWWYTIITEIYIHWVLPFIVQPTMNNQDKLCFIGISGCSSNSYWAQAWQSCVFQSVAIAILCINLGSLWVTEIT